MMGRTPKITEAFKKVKARKLKNTGSNKRKKAVVDKPREPTKEEKELDALKKFDLNWEYGPCIGITRLERWERAKNANLDPPCEIKDLILQHHNDTTYTECVWSKYEL